MQELSNRLITAVRCQDIQTGLQDMSLGQFDLLLRAGMAARLAIHIRGGDVVQYDHLKVISYHLFGIPTIAFDPILNYLADIEFIRIVRTGRRINSIIPSVPYFEDLYEQIGERAETEGFNELEVISIDILDRLSSSPVHEETIRGELNVNSQEFRWLIDTGMQASYLNRIASETGDILTSPLYFSENAEKFARLLQKHGEDSISRATDLLRRHPGIPFEKFMEDRSLLGPPVDDETRSVLSMFVEQGITQPPSIVADYSGTNHFLFVPPVGTRKIPVVEKEIYERAMAIVSSVRQGEYFGTFRIRSPIYLLRALLDRKELRPTTTARAQYSNLVVRRICRLEDSGNGFESVHLIDLPENVAALELAIEMLSNPDFIENRGFEANAQTEIFDESAYKESMRSYQSARKVSTIGQREQSENAARLVKLIQGI